MLVKTTINSNSITNMPYKMLPRFTYLLIISSLLLFAPANADDQSLIWNKSSLINPVFKGDTFFMEGGKKNAQSMVLLHGAGDNASRIWEPFLQKYGDRYHLITFDLPGFGRSSKENLLYSPEAYSDFLDWLITKYAHGPVVLLGHSMGGALALHFAAIYPEHVNRLIVVDSAGVLHRSAFSKNFLQLDPLKKWPKILSLPLEKPLSILNHLSGTTVENIERESSGQDINSILNSPSLRKLFLGGNPKTIASLAVAEEDLSILIERISAPTYIIWGAEDELTPLRTGKSLASLIPGSKLEIIEDAGHNPVQDQQALFHQALEYALIYVPELKPVQEIELSGNPGNGSCRNRSGMTFSGSYESIDIWGCTDVHLQNVSAKHIKIGNSHVVIENSRIKGKGIGLHADHSKIVTTGLSIDSDVAVYASGSRLDMAATIIRGREAAFQADEQTFLLFSISRIESPYGKESVHGVRHLTRESPL